MTVTEAFAEWALLLRVDDLFPDVRDAAVLHLLDGIGCALAAARSDAAAPAVSTATALGGPAEATILGGARVGAPAAALANGALVHALDFDDTHTEALVHATAAVLPAAFAAGETHRASGAEVLVACVAGYTMAIRLGAAVRHGFHARGFHATSVCGVFAGTLAAARLAGLSREQTVHALGIAGSLASGSLEFLATGSSTKALHPGLAGMNAIIAVRLAAAGADGPASIVEGDLGLFASFADATVDPKALVADLDVAMGEIRMIAIKPYPVCQLSVASLDALLVVLRDTKVSEVASIAFDIPPGVASIVADPVDIKRIPRTSYEAKFSLPFCAASLAIDGRLDIDSFAASALTRTDVLDLAARISHRIVDVPVAPADAPGIVRVTLRDGSEREARSGRASGGADAPLEREAIIAKFYANAGGRSERTERLADDVQRLWDLPSLETIVARAHR